MCRSVFHDTRNHLRIQGVERKGLERKEPLRLDARSHIKQRCRRSMDPRISGLSGQEKNSVTDR